MKNQAQLTTMKVNAYTGNLRKNTEILTNGGAVRITTVSGSGRWTSYYTCQYPSQVEGYDLVEMNDAPRGGKTGRYIAATKPGDKTYERAQFIRTFRRNWLSKIQRELANTPEAIRAAVMNKVVVLSDVPAPEGDERYWINGYFGCGVYRLVIQAGRIVASIYGGYHNSIPYGVDYNKWHDAIISYLNERLGDDYSIVKADGSGCDFFLRHSEDAGLIHTAQYNVPSMHFPYTHENIQITA